MIIKADQVTEEEGVRRYPIKGVQDTLGHFAHRLTTPDNPFGPHSHDFEEFWFILNGEGTASLDDEKTVVGEGDLIITPPGASHGLTTESEVYWLCFAKQ